MSWYACELHCHTVHSDGDFTVNELQHFAKNDNLSLIALTDHNTFSGCEELDDSIIPAIRGIEWTTYFGHMLVLGSKYFVDWRDARPYNIDQKLAEVKNAEGVIGIAHPFQIGTPICTGGRWEFNVTDWSKVDYIEVLHDDLRAFSSENDKAPVFWSSLLDKGFKIAGVYGRDLHRNEQGGHYGVTYIDIDDAVNEKNALEAIKCGRTVISGGFGFFMKALINDKEYRLGDTVPSGKAKLCFDTDTSLRADKLHNEHIIFDSVKIFTNGDSLVCEAPADVDEIEVTLEKGHWYRAELWGSIDGFKKHLAITSPIYCEY